MAPRITGISLTEYDYPVEGSDRAGRRFAIRVKADDGTTGSFFSFVGAPGRAQVEMAARAIVGENPLERERLWNEMRSTLRRYDGLGIGPLDIALWDWAGKYHDVPMHALLGTFRRELPAYASTQWGRADGGLHGPEAYADFAERCLELGYHGFKSHGFRAPAGTSTHERDAEIVRAVGGRVGDEMDLMHDVWGEYETWTDALAVGRACDEQGYLWYEDPCADARSHEAHRRLRERLDTLICGGELVFGLEAQRDLLAADAIDILHIDPEYHGGITGSRKIAAAAEAAGVDVQFHAPGPARRHLMAATRNTHYYELGLVHPEQGNPTDNPVYVDGYSDALAAIDADGCVPVPDGPGLGVTIDWNLVADNAVEEIEITEE